MRLTADSLRSSLFIAGIALVAGCAGAAAPPAAQGVMTPMQTLSTGGIGDAKKCGPVTGGAKVLPCTVTFKNTQPQQVTVSAPGAVLFKVASKPCKGIATFKYFDYGIFTVTPTTKAGTCDVVFSALDSNSKLIGTAQLALTNKG